MTAIGVMALSALIAVTFGFVVGRWLAVLVAGLAWPVVAILAWTGDHVGLWTVRRSAETDESMILQVFVAYAMSAAVGAGVGVLLRRLWLRARRSPSGSPN